MKIDKAERDFLERVRDGRPLGLADRAQDRVRQRCRNYGLAKVAKKPRRWVLTELGQQSLADANSNPPTGDRTMKAEERAEKAWAEISSRGPCACLGPPGACPCIIRRRDILASAIRSAEDEALERAAKELAMYEDEASGCIEEEWAFGKAVEVVRALKSKEP